MVLEPTTVDLESFVRHVSQLNIHLGAHKDIALVSEIAPSVTTGYFDPKRIEQVLDNLIGNAFKFSHPGTTVSLSVKQDRDHLVFSVADQGQGIKEEDLP